MGSKHLMAAVADELSQQQRWLAHYQVAEKRHARRVMLQGVLHRLDLARRALMRVLRRLALLFLRVARSVASFVSATAVALFTAMHGAATACIAWLRPRAYALALLLRKWLAAFWAWTVVQSRALAVTLARWASAAWAWTSVHAAMLARGIGQGRRDSARRGSEPHRSRSPSRSGVASSEFCDGPGRCREFSRAMRFKAPASPRHGPPPLRVRSPSLCGNGPPRPGHGLAWRRASSRALRSRERGRHRHGPPPTHARPRPRYSAMFPPAPPGREQMPKPRAAPLSPQLRRAILGPRCTSGASRSTPSLPRRRLRPSIAPWRSGAARRWSASNRSACTCR